MAASPSPLPRSIMRRLNGSLLTAPSRQHTVDDNLSYLRSLDPPSAPHPSTPGRHAVRFSPAPDNVFETYSPRDYDRRPLESSPRPAVRSGHLDIEDLERFRHGLAHGGPAGVRTAAPGSLFAAGHERGAGRSRFSLDDPFEDVLSDEDEGEEGRGDWRSSMPRSRTRTPSPIPRLQFNTPESDSEIESQGSPEGPHGSPLGGRGTRRAAPSPREADTLNTSPIALLATSFSDMPMPLRENIWPTPLASEVRPSQFEDHFGSHIDYVNVNDVLFPSSSPHRLRASPVAVPPSPSTPSRRTLHPIQTSPMLTRSISSQGENENVCVPTTPTRSGSKLRSPKSPPRAALSPRENTAPLGMNPSSISMSRGFRARLVQSRTKRADQDFLMAIAEHEDDDENSLS